MLSDGLDDIAPWATTILAGGYLYYSQPNRTQWEDHQILFELREVEVYLAQVVSGVRKLVEHPAKSSDALLNRRYGRVRIDRWAAAAPPATHQPRGWCRELYEVKLRGDRYASALRSINALHDLAGTVGDFRLGTEAYQRAVRECTLRHFPPMPPAPAWRGPTPAEEDAARERRIAARIEAALWYADAEINHALAGGPFALFLSTPDGRRSAELTRVAATISGAWLVLSHPRKSETTHPKAMSDRDRAYAELGQWKALVKYPDLRRDGVRPAEGVVALIGAPPPEHADFTFPKECESRTYDVSYTRNAGFRAQFDEYVEKLVCIKQRFDPGDLLQDYRSGAAEYRHAVEQCVAQYFPPRVPPLALYDELNAWRSNIYNRMAGPSQVRDAADARLFLEKALYFAEVAEGLNLDDVPPLVSTSASFEEIWGYFSALLKSCRRRIDNDARQRPPWHDPGAAVADATGGSGAPPRPSTLEPLAGWIAVADAARHYGLTANQGEALRKRLDRYRRRNLMDTENVKETSNRAPGEPQFLYSGALVHRLVLEIVSGDPDASGQTSGPSPAK
jgi:hypothetical protein